MIVDRVKVPSQRDNKVTYVVTFVGNTPLACTCPDYNFRSADLVEFECKHMRSARTAQPITQAEIVRLRTLLARA